MAAAETSGFGLLGIITQRSCRVWVDREFGRNSITGLLLAFLFTGALFVPSAASAAGLFGSTPQMDQAAAKATNEPIEQLTRDVEHMHPVAMFVLAKRQFDAGNLDEAGFWYYEGKLRWLSYLYNNPSLGGPFGEADRFSVFDNDISPDIDWCLTGNLPKYLALVGRVLDWDASHADDFTPNVSAAKQKARDGLKELVANAQSREAEIKKAHDEEVRSCPIASSKDQNDPYSGSGGAMFGKPDEMVSVYDPKRFDAFQVGTTKKNEIIAALGPPELWFTENDGSSTISYSYHKPMLPSLSLAQRVVVTFKFNDKKVLTTIELPKNTSP
jgi:hypothetical protein